MRLTNFSDYALRVLMFAGSKEGGRITIEETSLFYGISRAHLMKVVNALTRAGYLKAVRGRSGGLILGREPGEIGIGDVIRVTEPDFALVECFTAQNRCAISNCCRLRGALREALDAFVASLDRYTLADLILSPEEFGIAPAA